MTHTRMSAVPAIASAEVEDFDLRALVAGCAQSYRTLALGRRLDRRIADSALAFHGAPDLTAQALDKLFDNARSFTRVDGSIALALERDADGAAIRFSNSGPLPPAPMQERLFDSLVSVRGQAATSGASPHLGVGLYVARLVAELHRGRASARNLADANGVEFTVALAGMPRRRLSTQVPADS